MLAISVESNLAAVSLALSDLAVRQLPFATARTVTALAKLAGEAEKKAMPQVFDTPTPFTVNSVAVQSAKKAYPEARVYIRDIAAQYLSPYEFGGMQFLGKKPGDLVPVNAATNAYGNLPRNLIRRYMGRPDVFMGKVKTKHGETYGLWQRPTVSPAKPVKGAKRTRGGKLANKTGHLKLLVSFAAPVETKTRLEFGDRAQAVVSANFDSVFDAEMANALATAK
ncbi:hypothetical protein [Paraburkholderia sp. HD33-4]|uniref:hypothetical protein n=1 Tax=Paraburkholderia sp. HD33-4 TaxID=2883242 RepID=UPI001F37038B|nr:hypothetical protein [Paraburkholderia sp. HD33-4]